LRGAALAVCKWQLAWILERSQGQTHRAHRTCSHLFCSDIANRATPARSRRPGTDPALGAKAAALDAAAATRISVDFAIVLFVSCAVCAASLETSEKFYFLFPSLVVFFKLLVLATYFLPLCASEGSDSITQ
jgi:Flp pilus assembly protein TadB